MDEIDFAREQLRRSVLRWANEVLPSMLNKRDQIDMKNEVASALTDAFVLAMFPMEEYKEYRDLVVANADAVRAKE